MEKTFSTIANKKTRHKRVRAKISGTAKKPRLCVFRSNQHIYAQLIDDEAKKILSVFSDFDIKKASAKDKEGKELKGNIDSAYLVGGKTAEFAKSKSIDKVVFDRGGYKYHGRVKAVADGARAGGLEF